MSHVLSACLLVVTFATSLFADDIGPATAKADPSLAPLYDKLKPLVSKYYPNATFDLTDNKIHFEFNTFKYLIHGRHFLGGYTGVREELGPQSPSKDRRLPRQGGVVGDISVTKGPYVGQAGMPQVLDRHYFNRLIMAPHSPKLDHHLNVSLRFAKDIPPELKKQFILLMNQFDKHAARSPSLPAKPE